MMVPLYSQTVLDAGKASARGIQLGKQGKYDEAIIEFDKALNTYNANSAKIFHNKGWVLELKKDIPGAIAAYEEAVRRNPRQLPSLERLGLLYYETEKYDEAVKTGEQVIAIDPKNQEVIKWLPDAYAKRLLQKRDTILAKQDDDKKKKEEEIKKLESDAEKMAPVTYFRASFDFMIRTAYYFRNSDEKKGYRYKKTPGLYANVPENMDFYLTPDKMFSFDLQMGTPYLGALSPALSAHTEKLEGAIYLGSYFFGLGMLGTHYKNDFAFGDGVMRTRNDFKSGVLFGYREEKASLSFKLYPRLLPSDGSSSGGTTLDTDYMLFDYRYKIDKLLAFYSWVSVKDFYYFNHDVKMSNYWGVYELGFGVNIGKYTAIRYLNYLNLNAEFYERFYMRDLNNDKPYKFANGQGWFGLNAGKWLQGDPFSGYRCLGHVLSIGAEEGINRFLFLYQKIMLEIVDRKEDHNEYNFLLGVGGTY